MAYDQVLTAALSGATVHQLRHWGANKTGKAVLVPEYSAGRPRLYSFRDVLALRTYVFLDQKEPLQQIRAAFDDLCRIDEPQYVSAHTLVSSEERMLLVAIGEGSAAGLLQSASRREITALADVLRPFVAPRSGIMVPDLYQPRECVTVDPLTRGGRPVITGTRVDYDIISGEVDAGSSEEFIRACYPTVTRKAMRDAADFAHYVESFRLTRSARAA